jgi:hypothetical protein
MIWMGKGAALVSLVQVAAKPLPGRNISRPISVENTRQKFTTSGFSVVRTGLSISEPIKNDLLV